MLQAKPNKTRHLLLLGPPQLPTDFKGTNHELKNISSLFRIMPNNVHKRVFFGNKWDITPYDFKMERSEKAVTITEMIGYLYW